MPENTSHNSLGRLWVRSRPIIARHRRNPLFKGIARFSHLWLKAYENCVGEFEKNGEQMILNSLRNAPIESVFDVGSNVGDWSLLSQQFFPKAKMYAFELSPPTFEKLQTNIQGRGNIQAFNFGLSDHEGETTFYHYPQKPGETSTIAHSFQSGGLELKGKLRAGDTFCEEKGLANVDLLKIDVEGAESFVLRGFEKMLAAHRISVIQFEYEKVNPMTKFLLRDFYEYLGNFGYTLGKVFPTYVDFREYSFEHEMLWGSNYLAVLRSRPDLLKCFPA